MQTHFLGIEIGGTKLQIVAGNDQAVIVDRRRFTVDRAKGGAGIRAHIEATLPELIQRWQPTSVGVGFGGPVDGKSGRIAKSHQIEGWSEFPLAEWLNSIAKLPVWIENDANTAALAEALRGAGGTADA